MKKMPTLRSRFIQRTAIMTLAGMLAIVVFILYLHRNSEMEVLRSEMRERAELLRIGLLSTMMATGERDVIRKAVDSFKDMPNVQFRIFESKYVQNQHGGHPDEIASDPTVLDVLEGRLDEYEELSGTTFRYITPVVSDESCQRCHQDLNGDPIPVGTRLGVMEFNFDVSGGRKAALMLTNKILLGILLFIMVLVYSIYRMVDKSVLKPIRNLTDNFANLEKEDFNITLPRHDTEEIDVLIRQVRKTAAALEERKNHRLRALEEEREKVNQIRSFALEQADLLGITDETDISHIITRLSDAVQEVEKTEMFAGVSKFVTLESKNLVLENDVSLIRPAALYLTDLLSAFKGSVKKGSVELALEESITNAIVHGNLEIPSELKEKSFDEFYKEVARRSKNPPYSARRIRVSYEYENRRVRFTISDDGPGFDWKSYVDDGREADQLLVHGRGITIMRTFASSIQYNKQGNEVTLTFEV